MFVHMTPTFIFEYRTLGAWYSTHSMALFTQQAFKASSREYTVSESISLKLLLILFHLLGIY